MHSAVRGRPAGTLPRTTLRARMTLSVTLLCLGVLTLAGTATYLGAQAALRQNLDNALISIARAEIASAVDGEGGAVHVHDEEPSPLELVSGSSYEKFAQIEDAADQIVARTRNLTGAPLAGEPEREKLARAGIASFGDLTRGAVTLRALYYPLHDRRGNPLITVCAISKAHMEQSLRSLRTTLLLMLTASGLLAAFAANRLAQRLTSPLERIAKEARAIDEVRLDARLSVPAQDAELQDLADILNAMLHRLETAFATQRQMMDSQSRFLVDASHELRSPLANLRGTIEVALRRPREADDYRETLTASMIEIERLSRLVNDLLTLSRTDTGQFSFHFAPCDLAELTRRSVAAHAARAGEAHLALSVDAPVLVPVRGDVHRLRQILDNLLDNALRYAPVHSVIRVRVQSDGGAAAVTVRDEGPGLSVDDQIHIFDRFYRADESRTRSTGGLGLGLAIARAFAEAHQGTLSVASTPGEGAAFTLTLPVPCDHPGLSETDGDSDSAA